MNNGRQKVLRYETQTSDIRLVRTTGKKDYESFQSQIIINNTYMVIKTLLLYVLFYRITVAIAISYHGKQ